MLTTQQVPCFVSLLHHLSALVVFPLGVHGPISGLPHASFHIFLAFFFYFSIIVFLLRQIGVVVYFVSVCLSDVLVNFDFNPIVIVSNAELNAPLLKYLILPNKYRVQDLPHSSREGGISTGFLEEVPETDD